MANAKKKSYLPIGIAIAALAAVYLLGPIDIIPDFLAGVGQLDDALVLVLSALAEIKLIADSAKADKAYEEAPVNNKQYESAGYEETAYGAYKEI